MLKKIQYIILLGLLLRILAVIFIGNFRTDYYWEYGEIAKNILNGNGYSLFYIEDSKIQHHFKEGAEPSKSAYMPPGYVYFLFPFMVIDNLAIRNSLIYFLQIIISTLTIYLVYLLTRQMFNESTAYAAALITALLPEFIYAVLSFSPTVIYHLLILLILIPSLKALISDRYQFYIALLIAVTIYFRSEFVLFFLMYILLLLLQKKYKFSLKVFFIVLILILPWSIRNYLTFYEVIPFSTSFGLNLYRGNSPEEIGSWGDEEIFTKTGTLQKENLELELNRIYVTKVFSFLKEKPVAAVKNLFLKMFYFWIYYPNDQRSLHPLHLIPSLILLILFVYGMATGFNWNEYKVIYLFLISSTIVVLIFFPMARYQTMMKIAMMPFSALGIRNVVDYFNPK